ncbi:hypothetical protein [Pseudomonas sp. CCI3.1]|uniref:hypothetical protein n=1 Tax=Pseudomonas sp. CCI3.1 TaxID=3048618 RepID=UPI002AB57DB8|nr:MULTISPECIES: hypothetical protein [unclassified Pseudomonas]MDY7581295.1 hypothetical protein [Pseudomonas sp. CCI3.1]MEB0068206.1 hypothetical protein [Pseudomonas sp. CCI3.1]MEB0072582.1 hypothetical protein [Pseudomonas sp. CCI1.4]
MKYHGLTLRPMQESGAFLLRAMQNEDMPRLDLLVRESVQNSLDAAIDKLSGGHVRVDFSFREHSTAAVTNWFHDGIDVPMLNERYPVGGRLLEIRDTYTEGLGGPLTFSHVNGASPHGNLLKLVFEIGRTRDDEGAGGSWGLGKTCYFRMGLGFVLYYSRIHTENGYQERLVASIVENEASQSKVQCRTQTGIAWWGDDNSQESIPVTDSSKIAPVLAALGVSHFHGDETGTVIVIPFLRDDLIIEEEPGEDGQKTRQPWWCSNYEAYTEISLQRWFAARLDNPLFPNGPWLDARVNGNQVRRSEMLPVFQVMQSLYNRAAADQVLDDDYLKRRAVSEPDLTCRYVNVRNEFENGGQAGKLAAVILNSGQLGMGAPDNEPSPATCIFGRMDTSPPYSPIVTYVRKPGMNICWNDGTESRGWSGGLVSATGEGHLIAVFVPHHEQVLVKRKLLPVAEGRSLTLEAYLRSCERSDHTEWVDKNGVRIVDKIRTNTGRALKDFGGKPAPASNVKPAVRMARNLADLVMPKRGFGQDGRSGRPAKQNRPRAEGLPRTSNPTLYIERIEHISGSILVHWSLAWGAANPTSSRVIDLRVDSETGSITNGDWAYDLGDFPFRIGNCMVESQGVAVKVTVDNLIQIQATAAVPPSSVTGQLRIDIVTSSGGTLRPALHASLMKTAEAEL